MNRKANRFHSVVWKLSGSFAWWAIFTGCLAMRKELIVPHEFVDNVSWYAVSFRYVCLFLQKTLNSRVKCEELRIGFVLFVLYMCWPSNSAGAVWDDETPCLLCTVSTTWLNQCAIRIFTLLTVGSTWNHEYSWKCFVYIYIPSGFMSDTKQEDSIKKQLFRIYTDCCIWMFLTTPLRSQTTLKKVHTHTDTHTHQKNNMVLGLGGCEF